MSIISHLWGQSYYKQRLSTGLQWAWGQWQYWWVWIYGLYWEQTFRDKAKLKMVQRISVWFSKSSGKRCLPAWFLGTASVSLKDFLTLRECPGLFPIYEADELKIIVLECVRLWNSSQHEVIFVNYVGAFFN